ncbi:MAG TPA: signal recognition particle-docking protein FtsY [Acidimicrobiales bacterium]|nr:signal recognition particle-docking protein FtsY [Acidimicrobiales bacterium]
MLTLIIVLIVVAVVLIGSAGLYVSTRSRRRLPPAPPVRPPEARPKQPPRPEVRLPEAEAPPGTVVVEEPAPVVEEAPPALVEAPPRFRDRLGRARSLFGGYLTSVRSRGRIDETTWEELEEALILADVGATVAAGLLDDLRSRVKKEGIDTADQLIEVLKAELVEVLQGDRELRMAPEGTTVWLFVGVNGVGKTTTIGKLGLRQAQAGHRVVMAAGDTFRAAAADQLEMWSQRVGAAVIRGNEGGDPGAVVFDAVQHAAARGADLVLADTAGRLHTKTNLMEELKKVRRVAERPPGVVTEVLLVVDATTGQNGLIQARQFADAVGVTGVVLTKLDGTAKGGIVVAIRSELGIPIKLVGLGEGAADLVDFDAAEFVDAIFSGE